MSSPGNEAEAASLKTSADTAYRSKKYPEARALYAQSTRLHDLPATRSNLSMTEYELGLYSESISNAERAIRLIDAGSRGGTMALKVKNQTRLVRALAIQKRPAEALRAARVLEESLPADASDDLRESTLTLVDVLERNATLPSVSSADARACVSSLPLFRPALRPALEYYSVSQPSDTFFIVHSPNIPLCTSDGER